MVHRSQPFNYFCKKLHLRCLTCSQYVSDCIENYIIYINPIQANLFRGSQRLGNKEAPFVKSVVLVLQLGEKVLDYFYDENFYAT